MEPYYADHQYNIGTEESVGYQPYENSNSWSHHSLILPPSYNSGITSLEYDSLHELIWMGHESGRISSYMNVSSNEVNDEPLFSEPMRCSSFLASDQAINNVLPVHKSIFSITSTSISMYNSGGMYMGQFAACIDETTLFTRGTLLSSDVSLLSSEGQTKTHLIVGTSATKTFAYDLSMGMNPVLAFNTKSPVVCVKSSTEGNFIGVGCSDGNIRIIDGRLRSHHIERGFKAHTGSVNDLVMDEANMIVMSVGLNSRAINPYDPQSPVTYQPDTSIKVFDMRMMSPGRPIPLSIPSPNTIQSIFNSDGSESRGGGSVMVTSTDGYIQFFNGGFEQESEVMFGGFEGGSPVTSSAVSSSGQFTAIGSSEGINQFICNTTTTTPVVNFMSMEVDLPDNTASTPEVSLSVDVPSLGTSYVILENEIPPSMPRSSDFDEVGAMGFRTFRNTSQIQVSDSLMDRITWQGFIGAATRHSNVAPNSLLFGDKKRPHSEKSYFMADPRKNYQNNDNDDDGNLEANDIPETHRRVLSHRGKMRINRFDYSACNATNLVGLENTLQHSAFINAIIQTLILLPELRDAALQSQISTYHHTRETLWCEIGFLVHHMLELQKSALKHDLIQKVVTASNFDTIFKQIPEAVAMDLFDNIQKGDVLQNRVQAFCRFLIQQLKSEIEQQSKTKETKNVTGSKKIQIVSATQESSVVEDTFGLTVTTETTFLNSSTVETGQPNKALILDLIYPSIAKKGGVKKAKESSSEKSPSFASVLYGSMRRVAYMKGWCSASESYEPLKQVRSVNVRTTMLPKVLTMNCGDTAKDSEQTVLGEAPILTPSLHTRFYSSTNIIGGPWIPDEFEVVRDDKYNLVISIHVHSKADDESKVESRWLINDGTKERVSLSPASKCDYADVLPFTVESTTYKLFSVVSQVKTKKNNGGHAVAQVRSIMEGRHDQDDDNWILLNDFFVQPCNFHEVCSFPTWKHPCILFFAKADHTVTTLNYEDRDLIHSIPESVLRLRSLSSHTSLVPPDSIGKDTLVAFDAEFVATESEKASLSAGGQRIVSDDGRQVLARISLIDEKGEVLLDDYVRPSEPVVDYLTRFSGLTPEDLDPSTSTHPLITNRAAHLKLRYFLDKGCIFVGHGLQKDFETANLFVPPEQIRDTVELWRFPGQRKISLRFLAGFLLERKIQDEIHDSIEDAKTALDLYKYYMEVKEKGDDELTARIQEIYDYGAASSWTLMS